MQQKATPIYQRHSLILRRYRVAVMKLSNKTGAEGVRARKLIRR